MWKHSVFRTIQICKVFTFKRIVSLSKGIVMEMTNQNHSTYWIVNHWNLFKLANIVSVILLENLNWRMCLSYNPFKLVQLEVDQTIFTIVHLKFEVYLWYWIFEWLDLPNLQSISLGDLAFHDSSFEIQGIDMILYIDCE